jgi:hypothetical protein
MKTKTLSNEIVSKTEKITKAGDLNAFGKK